MTWMESVPGKSTWVVSWCHSFPMKAILEYCESPLFWNDSRSEDLAAYWMGYWRYEFLLCTRCSFTITVAQLLPTYSKIPNGISGRKMVSKVLHRQNGQRNFLDHLGTFQKLSHNNPSWKRLMRTVIGRPVMSYWVTGVFFQNIQ